MAGLSQGPSMDRVLQGALDCKEIDQYNGLNDLDWYIALCLGGMRLSVKEDVERYLGELGRRAIVQEFVEDFEGATHALKDGVHTGQAGCSKLLVFTDASPDELRGLRSVQSIFALVAQATSLDIALHSITAPLNPGSGDEIPVPGPDTTIINQQGIGRDAAKVTALDKIVSLVANSPLWPKAIHVWKQFMCQSRRHQSRTFGETEPSHINQRMGDGEIEGKEAMRRAHIAAICHSSDEDGDKTKTNYKLEQGQTFSYRASVVRDGHHAFNSTKASARLGDAVGEANLKWTVDLKDYDLEVVAVILHKSIVVGIALGDREFHSANGRLPKEERGLLSYGNRLSSLRPSTTYAMLHLAKPVKGDVIVDCMCGVGTVPICSAQWFPGTFAMGGELDSEALCCFQGNLRSSWEDSSRQGYGADGCAWDVQALPLRDSCVDIMVVDMPFGVSCGTPSANRRLYPNALTEMARVLRPGSGRAILLVASPKLLRLPGLQSSAGEGKGGRGRGEEKGESEGVGNGLEGEGRRKSETAGECKGDGDERLAEVTVPSCLCKEAGADVALLEEETMGGKMQGNRSCRSKERNYGGDSLRGHGSKALTSETPVNLEAAAVKKGVLSRQRGGRRKGDCHRHSDGNKLWNLEARHTVNVGGMLTCIVVLKRTDVLIPSDLKAGVSRKKSWVGVTPQRRKHSSKS